jgi:hypothetical protein
MKTIPMEEDLHYFHHHQLTVLILRVKGSIIINRRKERIGRVEEKRRMKEMNRRRNPT